MGEAEAHHQHSEQKRKQNYDVFVSHSTWKHVIAHQRVDELVQILINSQLKIFLDRLELKSGEPLLESIQAAIECSRVGLVVMTRTALASGWVNLEIDWMLKQQASKRMSIVALHLEADCPKPKAIKFDFELDLFETRDLFSVAEKIKKIVRAVRVHC